jgi:hypothetical protein
MALIPNRPTPEGREAGEHLARFCDESFAELSELPLPERCGTCAFRAGTIPNGCLSTFGDALKCVYEGDEFFCHEKPSGEEPQRWCAGWIAMRASYLKGIDESEAEFKKFPWKFSDEYTLEDSCVPIP